MNFLSGLVIGFIGGVIGGYLFFRNNPKHEKTVDDIVDEVEEKVK